MNTLREISEGMRWLQEKVLNQGGELIDEDFDNIVEIEDTMENKVDAIIHVVEGMDRQEDRIKTEIKRLQSEQKHIDTERKKLKNYMVYCLNGAGLKSITTRFHRVFVRKARERWEYDKKDKLFETIDQRCIVVKERREVSIERAKEIHENTGTMPRGFEVIRGLTTLIK